MTLNAHKGEEVSLAEPPLLADGLYQPESELLKQVRAHLTNIRFKRFALFDYFFVKPKGDSGISFDYGFTHNEVRKHWIRNRKTSVFFPSLISLPVVIYVVFTNSYHPSVWALLTVQLVFVAWIGYEFWTRLTKVASDTATKLRDSNILQRIAVRDDSLFDIFNYTTEPFKTIFLGSKPESLVECLTFVADNLDWYLCEPGRLLRVNWVFEVIVIPVLLVSLMVSLQSQTSQSPNDLLINAVYIAVLCQSLIPSLFALCKREVLLEEFMIYVGDQLKH